MKRELSGSRILITGASEGIGKALAEQAVHRGARVGLAARSADKLAELARTLAGSGGEALAIPADVTSAADAERMLDAMVERFGGLDVLVNNAGIASFGHFAESSESLLRQIMEVNFFAPAELIRRALPLLRQGRQPAIVNVSSMCGRTGLPAWPEYSASKFALSGLTEALAAELVRFGIHVMLVTPGLTSTKLMSHLLRAEGRRHIDMSRGMSPQWVADKIWRGLMQGRRELILGWEAKWILRLNRWLPGLVARLKAREVRKLYASDLAPETVRS